MSVDNTRLTQRMDMLDLEKGFIDQKRGQAAEDHMKVLDKTLSLMTSKQMEAFKIDKEPQGSAATATAPAALPAAGDGPPAGQVGVPFIEVDSAAGTTTRTSSPR